MIDAWNDGDPYEYFMGRWSKLMAPEFLKWLAMKPSTSCLEVGCGTGALSEVVLNYSSPTLFNAIDPSAVFIAKAKERLQGKGTFHVANVNDLPYEDKTYNHVISGLALNFFPDLPLALNEMKRVLKPNGSIAAYVWDYSGKMEMLRYFWDVVLSIDPESKHLDEGIRFPICSLTNLEHSFLRAGLKEIRLRELTRIAVFKNFEDYWKPFLGGQGPAPSYLTSLSDSSRSLIKQALYQSLPTASDGSIHLNCGAIAIQGFIT